MLHGSGDLFESTGSAVGDTLNGRKGDFVVTLDPSWTRGLSVRVAIEAKSGPVGLANLSRELEGARRNRDAAVALAVYRVGNAPAGCAPLTLHGEHVICEYDPEAPDDPAFAAAFRLARALALAAARGRGEVVDIVAVRRNLDGIRAQLKAIQGMKCKLTSIASATTEVSAALDVMRQGVLDCVASIEADVADIVDIRSDVA